ncbi:MAG: SPFH domain-containing protein [Candidatus Dormibacteria bacterium]
MEFFIIKACAVVVLLVLLLNSIKIVPPRFVGLVQQFGVFKAQREAGIVFLVPFVQRTALVDMREMHFAVDDEHATTRDSVTVLINATIFLQVVDPKAAIFNTPNYRDDTYRLARSTIRTVVGSSSTEEVRTQLDRISTLVKDQMGYTTTTWGVRITRVDVTVGTASDTAADAQ